MSVAFTDAKLAGAITAITYPFSIGCYVKFSNHPEDYQDVAALMATYGSYASSSRVAINNFHDTYYAQTTTAGGTPDYMQVTESTGEFDGVWMPMLLVCTDATTRRLYVGTSSDFVDDDGTSIALGTVLDTISIGRCADSYRLFTGLGAEFAFWSKGLSGSEAADFMENAIRPSAISSATANLIGYYPCDEDGVFVDMGPNGGPTLTLTGTASFNADHPTMTGGGGGSTFTEVGTSSEYSNDGNPWATHAFSKPTGVVAGDLIVITVSWYSDIGDGDPTIDLDAISGFTKDTVLIHTYNDTSQFHRTVFYKTADGTEGSSFTVNRSINFYGAGCIFAIHTDDGSIQVASVTGGTPQETDNATCVAPSVAGSTGQLLVCGFNYEDPTGAIVTPPTGMTVAHAAIIPNSQVVAAYFQALSSTGATGTKSLVVTTPQRNEGWSMLATVFTATMDWQTDPSVTSQTTTAYTISYRSAAISDNIYVGAYLKDSTPPSIAQLKAGANAHGTATEATTGSPDSIVLTPSDSPKFPVYDLYAVSTDSVVGDSPLITMPDEFLDPAAGKQYVTLAGPFVSFLAGSGAEDGDILVADTTVQPGGFALTIQPNGSYNYPAGGDASEQIFYEQVYDVSAGDWLDASPVDIHTNNPDPFVGIGVKTPVNIRAFVNVAMTAFLPLTYVTDDDAMTAAYQSGTLPTGVSESPADSWGGTPSVSGIYRVVFRCTDDAGDYCDLPVSFTIGPKRPQFVGTVSNLSGTVGVALGATNFVTKFDHDDDAEDPANFTYTMKQLGTSALLTTANGGAGLSDALTVDDASGIAVGDYIATAIDPTRWILVVGKYGNNLDLATKITWADATGIYRRPANAWAGNGTIAFTGGSLNGTPSVSGTSSELVARATRSGEIADSATFSLTVAPAGGSVDLSGIPSGWNTVYEALYQEEFLALARVEASGSHVWAYWEPGAIHGTANLHINIPLIKQEASGNHGWARWDSTGLREFGNLQINLHSALTAGFALT